MTQHLEGQLGLIWDHSVASAALRYPLSEINSEQRDGCPSCVPSCTPASLLKKLKVFKPSGSSAPHGLPSFIVPLDTIWYGMSRWPVEVSCPWSVPSQLLVPPPAPHCGAARGAETSSVQHRSAKAETSLRYQLVFLPKPKHSITPATVEKINCVPAETRTASLD